ncbi:MAG: Ig-like domain-containing protein [Prevotellaceae bacterium]|jgi:uncharacterized protein YjdB|nr:Ig-like domain-containing protein [Prevotellaceae bacterium]
MKKTKLCIAAIAMLFTSSVFAQSTQRGYYDAPYTRYEADVATGTGTVVNNTNQNNIAFEASERKVVKLTNGQSRTFTTTAAFRGVVVRASGATGETTTSGTNVSVDVTAGGTTKTLTFDASYGWKNLADGSNSNYNGVSNSNRRMRYDEQRCLFDNTIASGQTITVTSKSDNVYLDFIEAEDVPAAIACPTGYTQYPGSGDLKSFIENTPNPYIPAGNYTISNYVDAGTGSKIIRGAGKWYTNITFSGNQAGFVGHSKNCGIRDMYLNCTNKSRSNSNKGIRGVWGTVTDMWVEHFECGAWIGNYDGNYGNAQNADGMQVTNCRFRSNYADGINFCRGTINSKASHCNFRSNGDDDMAVWPADGMNCTNNTFEYNTAEHCWFASSCACYGGQGNKWQYIIVRDNWDVGLRSNTEFAGSGFTGTNNMSNIDVIRCGTTSGAYNAPLAAIDIQGGSTIRIECIDVKDPLGDAISRGASNATACGVSENGGLIPVGAWMNTDTNCSCSTVTISGVTVNSCPTSLQQGGATQTLTATVAGSGGTIPQTVTWSSSNTARASVDATGKITTGSETGSVIITATSTADNSKKGTCTFNVTAIPVTGVTLVNSKTAMSVGDEYTFTASVQPSTVNQAVTWNSSDPTVASIGTDGKVTALKAGTTVIKATSVQDGTTSVQITLTVSNVSVSSVSISDATVAVNSNVTLTPTINPSNATNKAVTFSIVSGGTYVQLVNAATGEFKGLAAGQATVQVKTTDGDKTATAKITVTNCTATGAADLTVESISWTPANPAPGAQVIFTATVKNSGGTALPTGTKFGVLFRIDGATTYVANSNTYVWADELKNGAGLPTALAPCATITFTANNGDSGVAYWTAPGTAGNHTVEAWVDDNNGVAEKSDTNNTLTATVTLAASTVTGVNITNCPSGNIAVGTPITLGTTVTGTGSFANTVTWSSSNPSISVNNGVVTATAAGTATITATSTQDTSKKGTCSVTFVAANVAVTGVTISPKTQTVTAGDQIVFSAIIAPNNATNQNVTYSIQSGGAYGSLVENVLTTSAAGEIVVRVTTADGGKYDEATITIDETTPPVQECDPIRIVRIERQNGDGNSTVKGTAYAQDNSGTVAISTATDNTTAWYEIPAGDGTYYYKNVSTDRYLYRVRTDNPTGWNGELAQTAAANAGTDFYKWKYVTCATWGDRYYLGNVAGANFANVTAGNVYMLNTMPDFETGGFYGLTHQANWAVGTNGNETHGSLSIKFAVVNASAENPDCNTVITGNTSIDKSDKTITAYNNIVEIKGIEKGEVITVYNLLGIKVFSARATTDPELITTLQQGIYTVVIEGTNVVQKVLIVR